MKTLQINTTQNVAINFELANVGQRFLAFIVDNIIKFAYLYFVFSIYKSAFFEEVLDGDVWSVRALDIIVLLPVTFYTLYSEILFNGQTLGKKLLKIRVINIDGFKPSITDYVIRWFLRIVDFNLFILLAVYIASLNIYTNTIIIYLFFLFGKLIGFFLIIITKNNQRVGDIAANTVVIQLKDQTKFSHTIIENLTQDYRPTYSKVIKLSDNDVRIIKETFKVAAKTKDYVTLIKLRTKIEEVTGIKSREKNDVIFIDKVLKDYNFLYTKYVIK